MPLQSIRRRQGYLPLESYAALGDGWTVALSGADGSVDWWCAPALDGQPVLNRLLDAPGGGRFVLKPRRPFTVERAYLPDSNLLVTGFATAEGRARLIEGIASEDSDPPSRSTLIRRVEGLDGTVDFVVEFRPASATPACELLATPDLSWKRSGRGLTAGFCVSPGEEQLLGLVAPAGKSSPFALGEQLDHSDQSWREWARSLTAPPRYAELIRRHALALKLLSAPSGAILAAATTSLPEKMGGERNWDFRYVWVRDAAYTIETLIQIGAVTDAARAFDWLVSRIADHGPRVAFDLNGAIAPTDRVVDLPGYRNSSPVRIGNVATLQSQHGVFGDMLQAADRLTAAGIAPEGRAAEVLADLAEDCARSWREPDSGIWELSELRLYANSRVSCWQALNYAVKLADAGHLPADRRDAWAVERDMVAAWIDDCCWCPERQSYVAWPDSEALDASLALLARIGYGSHERQAATVRAIDGELRTGLFHHRMSGVQETEGCFLACSFWLVEAKVRLGRRDEAAADFEALVSALGGVGVLPEMVEAGTGRWLGNMPQGLTHLALIQAAVALSEA